MKKKAKWTFMAYLAGDNSLSPAGENDLAEMRTVGSTSDINIVAEFDRAGKAKRTRRYLIRLSGLHESVKSLGETDSGDPNVLLSFVEWAAQKYPAERYALILWNHGGGWEPSDIDLIAQEVKARSYYAGREGTERRASSLGRAFFRTTWKTILNLGSVQERAICSDDGSGHSLDTLELGKVLAKAAEALGQPLDLLGMDACLMSNLEVAYQARPYVKYVVASEESEPNEGWPYDRVLRFLADNPDADTASFATHIVDAYLQSYVEREHDGPVTQSALDLSQVDGLANALDGLAQTLIPRMATAMVELGEALYATTANFWYGTLWDIADFCAVLATKTSDGATRHAALDVKAMLQPLGKTFVIAEAHSGDKVAHCGGTTIYLPPRILRRMSRYYSDLAFAKDHHWAEMLKAYNAP